MDETLHEILEAVYRIGARRLVIDSLAGFELALAPDFRIDFRESLYRMIGTLAGIGVTILNTIEIKESFSESSLSTLLVSFLTDDIIRLRYVEIEGKVRTILTIVKMRGGNHSKDIREYEITSGGLNVKSSRFKGYRGLISGIPEPLNRRTTKKREASSNEPKGKK